MARNDHFKYLGRPFADLKQALIAVKPFNMILPEQAVGSMHLKGLISHFAGNFGAVEF